MKKLLSKIVLAYSVPFYTAAFIYHKGLVDGFLFSVSTWLVSLLLIALLVGGSCSVNNTS